MKDNKFPIVPVVMAILVMIGGFGYLIRQKFFPVFEVGDCVAMESRKSDSWLAEEFGYEKILEIGKKSYRTHTYSKDLDYPSYLEFRHNIIYSKIECPNEQAAN